jgi:hypothetical protein
MARWAMNEATAQIRKGLELLPAIPEEVLRKEQELDLQIMLGQVFVATKGYGADEPAQTYARARELSQDLNRPAQLGQVLWGHWVFAMSERSLIRRKNILKRCVNWATPRKTRCGNVFLPPTAQTPAPI